MEKLTYEDCKKLKDAGFPVHASWSEKTKERLSDPKGLLVYGPSLSELIEACGDDFEALTMEHSRGGNEWVASSFDASSRGIKHGRGISPEQAVKNLWIALNKK